MRKVDKPSDPPAGLVTIQKEIEEQLQEKKERFSWEGQHYSEPVKEQLDNLYHGKCAYCESKLIALDTEELYTIEHYRPKKGEPAYWWLGNEWTNLFPLCKRCNNAKGKEFPVRYGMKRVKTPPLLPDGTLDRARCKAGESPLIDEQPEYLHPEVDAPSKFFGYTANGEMYAKEGLNNWDKSRASLMLRNALSEPYIVEKRKRYLEVIRTDLEQTINAFYEIVGIELPTDREVKLGFNRFFKKLYASKAHTEEFSTLAEQVVHDIDKFLLSPLCIESEVDITPYREILERAHRLFIEKHLT